MSGDYLELNFTIKPKRPAEEILIFQLAEIGFESFVDTEEGLLAYIPAESFKESSLNALPILKDEYVSIKWTLTNIPAQNWNAEWESSFEPIVIGNECCIRAPFHKEQPVKHDIIIEPKMSFGTGHHATTSLMIKKLLELDVANKPVLDMGCGTGVLAILAAKLGASPVIAIDIDEWSYINTKENIVINNADVIVYKGSAELLEGKIFHTILANINRNVLLADIKAYTSSLESNGNLVMSGFFETDIPAIISEAEKNGLKLEDKQTENTWALLHFIKN